MPQSDSQAPETVVMNAWGYMTCMPLAASAKATCNKEMQQAFHTLTASWDTPWCPGAACDFGVGSAEHGPHPKRSDAPWSLTHIGMHDLSISGILQVHRMQASLTTPEWQAVAAQQLVNCQVAKMISLQKIGKILTDKGQVPQGRQCFPKLQECIDHSTADHEHVRKVQNVQRHKVGSLHFNGWN